MFENWNGQDEMKWQQQPKPHTHKKNKQTQYGRRKYYYYKKNDEYFSLNTHLA